MSVPPEFMSRGVSSTRGSAAPRSCCPQTPSISADQDAAQEHRSVLRPNGPAAWHAVRCAPASLRQGVGPAPSTLAEVRAVALLQVVGDPEPQRVVHGEVFEFAGVDEADFGGLVADGELAAGDAGGVSRC